MAEETLTVPSGSQAPPTFVRHPQMQEKSERAAKFHKVFEELTHEELKPKEEKPVDKVEPVAEKPVETPKTETVEKPVEKTPEKPASPLDVLTSEKPEEVQEPDALKDIPKEIDGNEKQKANWSKLRGAADTGWAKVRELEAKLSEVEKAPKADPSLIQEHETLKQKIAKQEEYLKAINAEYSDEFQSLVGKREETLGKIAKRVRLIDGVDVDAFVGTLALPESKFRDGEIKKALAGLDQEDKTRVAALIEKLEEHDEQIADFRKDLPGKWGEIQAKRDAQLREQQEATIKTLETEFSKVVETIPSKNMTMKEVPEFDDWNSEIKSARENALRVLKPGGANFQESVEIAMKGARYDTLEKRYLQLHKDYSEAQKRLKEIDSSGPDFRGTGKPEKAAPKSAPQKFRETLEAIKSGQLVDV